ncbi:zinc finger protein 267-like [Belonocnema kinseyi]|uniref:zinc finger protein 267-like n=1 Tax=Belonocnema kinseyi TaxID=2817044 RepID=UPI00143DC872|nr:zinc finger protein 267-like [Belonocnema kinseyi]
MKTRKRSIGDYEAYPLKHQTEDHSELQVHNEKVITCKIEYMNDEALVIKEEISTGKSKSDLLEIERRSTRKYQVYPSKHQWEDHNLLPKSQEKDVTSEIEYINVETLKIKEEITKDYWNLSKRDVKPKPESKPTIQESNIESEKKYECKKCARCYTRKKYLTRHQKFECDITPQFKCKFCGKLFKQKDHMSTHIRVVCMHKKKNSKPSQARFNCDKCPRSYISTSSLYKHKLLEHAAVKPQFICKYCGYKTSRKFVLSRHITRHHVKLFSRQNFEP